MKLLNKSGILQIFLIIFLFTFNHISLSQVNTDWIIIYNGTANYFDEASGICTDKFGNIYVCGYSDLLSSYSADYITIKFSPSGDTIWTDSYDGPGHGFDQILSMTIDDSSNVYVTGKSPSNPSNSNYDYCTIKYNSSGERKWVARYDDPYHEIDIPVSVKTDNRGNCYVMGYSSQYFSPAQRTLDIVTIKYDCHGNIIWLAKYNNGGAYSQEEPASMVVNKFGDIFITGQSGASIYDMVTIKYDSSGNEIWARKYIGAVGKDDYGADIAVDSIGNSYALGSTTAQLPENFDYVTIKYNAQGDSQWVRTYNGEVNGSDFGRSIAVDCSSNVYVTGISDGSGSQNIDIVTIKYNSTGQLIWLSRYDSQYHMADEPSKIKLDPMGNIFIIGSIARAALNWDYGLIKYNPGGQVVWVKQYNGKGNSDDNGIDLAIDSNNNIYVTGTSYDNNTGFDIVTIKYSQPIGIEKISENIPNTFSLSQNYPNPFNPTTKIKFDISSNVKRQTSNLPDGKAGVKLVIYDLLGWEVATLVNEKLQPGIYEVEWDATNYSSGVYFYKLDVDGNLIETRKMVLIK